LLGCGPARIISTPIENIDVIPIKETEPTEDELKHWSHLDLLSDTIPGMSVDKAYSQIIQDRKGKKVIVAVIDTGVDIDHEDLTRCDLDQPKRKTKQRKRRRQKRLYRRYPRVEFSRRYL
jgi:hypothetical protein